MRQACMLLPSFSLYNLKSHKEHHILKAGKPCAGFLSIPAFHIISFALWQLHWASEPHISISGVLRVLYSTYPPSALPNNPLEDMPWPLFLSYFPFHLPHRHQQCSAFLSSLKGAYIAASAFSQMLFFGYLSSLFRSATVPFSDNSVALHHIDIVGALMSAGDRAQGETRHLNEMGTWQYKPISASVMRQ